MSSFLLLLSFKSLYQIFNAIIHLSICGQCELIDPCALASSKKLIVFSGHLERGIKKLISQGAGFDVYDKL